MSGYRFLSPAEDEMAQAALFYEAQTEGLGYAFLDNIGRVVHRLCEHPLTARLTTTFRSMILSRFPFKIIYKIEPESILIVAVAHQSRRPNYWKTRIGNEAMSGVDDKR